MSKSKESQGSTNDCPFCDVPCKNQWCVYTQLWEDGDSGEIQEQSIHDNMGD